MYPSLFEDLGQLAAMLIDFHQHPCRIVAPAMSRPSRGPKPDVASPSRSVVHREGDLVTITSRQDLIRALNEAVLAGESMGAGHGPRLGQQMLPALRISVVEVPEVRR